MNIVLTTDRLVVRRFEPDDATALHAYRNDPEVARWQGWSTPWPFEIAEAFAVEHHVFPLFELGDWTQLALAPVSDPSLLIGDIGVRLEAAEPTAEIGFTLARSYWGLGYAGEAVRAVVDHIFELLGLARVVAFTHRDNEAAQRVLERADLRFVALDGDELVYYRRAVWPPATPTR